MKNLINSICDVVAGFVVALGVLAVVVLVTQGCASSAGEVEWCYPNHRSEQQCFASQEECAAAADNELTYRPQCRAQPVDADGGHE